MPHILYKDTYKLSLNGLNFILATTFSLPTRVGGRCAKNPNLFMIKKLTTQQSFFHVYNITKWNTRNPRPIVIKSLTRPRETLTCTERIVPSMCVKWKPSWKNVPPQPTRKSNLPPAAYQLRFSKYTLYSQWVSSFGTTFVIRKLFFSKNTSMLDKVFS